MKNICCKFILPTPAGFLPVYNTFPFFLSDQYGNLFQQLLHHPARSTGPHILRYLNGVLLPPRSFLQNIDPGFQSLLFHYWHPGNWWLHLKKIRRIFIHRSCQQDTLLLACAESNPLCTYL